jgi:hypothetical protein
MDVPSFSFSKKLLAKIDQRIDHHPVKTIFNFTEIKNPFGEKKCNKYPHRKNRYKNYHEYHFNYFKNKFGLVTK